MRRVALTFRIILSLLVIGLLVGVYSFLRYVNSPVSASNIATSKTDSSSQKITKLKSSPIAVNGAYASFTYPSIFTPLKQQTLSGNILASYGYEHRALLSWQLEITINYLPSGSTAGDGSYYAMSQDPTRYNAVTETVNGSPVTTMSDLEAGGFNKIAFLFHGSYSADISLSSMDSQNASEEQAVLNQVVQSWQWK